jgi:hypothetical protein
MNTANLQLAGVLAALGAVIDLMRSKGIAGQDEIDRVLAEAEATLLSDPKRPTGLSNSNVEAMTFPLRFLRIANESDAPGAAARFTEIATVVGQRD